MAKKKRLSQLTSMVSQLKEITETVNTKSTEEENEFEVFGKHVGLQLKAMPLIVALEAQEHIQLYINQIRRQQLQNASKTNRTFMKCGSGYSIENIISEQIMCPLYCKSTVTMFSTNIWYYQIQGHTNRDELTFMFNDYNLAGVVNVKPPSKQTRQSIGYDMIGHYTAICHRSNNWIQYVDLKNAETTLNENFIATPHLYNKQQLAQLRHNINHHNSSFSNTNSRHDNYKPPFPSQPINILPNQNYTPKKYFSNQQVFGKPQNVFQPSKNFVQQPAEAMSTSSRNSNYPQPMSVSTRNTHFSRPRQNQLYNLNQHENPIAGPSNIENPIENRYESNSDVFFFRDMPAKPGNVSLVVSRKRIIECKKTDVSSSRAKEEEWKNLAHEFNSNCNNGTLRDCRTLRRKYENIKKRSKKAFAEEKLFQRGTGGGPKIPSKITNLEEIVKDMLGSQVTGLPTEFGGDSEDMVFEVVPDEGEEDYKMSNDTQPSSSQEVYKDWSKYTPSRLRQPQSNSLTHSAIELKILEDTGSSSKSPKSNRLPKKQKKTSEAAWTELGVAKLELLELQKNLMLNEAEKKEERDAEESRVKLEFMQEEHEMKMKILKAKQYYK
ncbi:hypothetical protein FQA39_LY18479 [Lamprigera yunnana]|nr:hypothetical protein FQA39_LY18479 [Lamprigera yunnana]